MNERELTTALQRLPKEISPPSDPWDEIESAMGSPAPRPLAWPAVAGIAAVLVASLAVFLVARSGPDADTPPAPPLLAERDAAPTPDVASSSGVATILDSEYGAAMRELQHAPRIDPAENETEDARDQEVREAFAEIAAAQRRLRERLEEDPDNLQLASLLALTHRQQARSLRALTATENSS